MTAWVKASPKAAKAAQSEVRMGVPFAKLKTNEEEGKFARNYFRILPPRADYAEKTGRKEDAIPWYHWSGVHYVNQHGYLCSDFHHQRFCLLCERFSSLKRAGKEDEAKNIRVQYYALANCVAVGKDGTVADDARVEILNLGKGTLDKIIGEIEEEIEDPDEQDISDPETGRIVIIRKHGKGPLGTKYEAGLGLQGDFNNGDYKLLEDMHDLTSVYVDPSEAMMNQLASGKAPAQLAAADAFADIDDDEGAVEGSFTVVDEDEEDEPEVAPAPAAKPKVKAKASNTDAQAARDRLRASLATATDDDDDD